MADCARFHDCTVVDSVASFNTGSGIVIGAGSTVTRSTVNGNHNAGIRAMAAGARIVGNTVRGNGSVGFELGAANPSGYVNNVLTGNFGGDANQQVNAGTDLGHNICGTHACPQARV